MTRSELCSEGRRMSSHDEYHRVAVEQVARTIDEKCQLLGKVLETSRAKFDEIHQAADEIVFQQLPLIESMNNVFEQLQEVPVDASMKDADAHKTLYDFVDAESVHSLQQDARQRAREVNELLNEHQHALSRIRAIYNYFCSFRKEHSQLLATLDDDTQTELDAKEAENLYHEAVSFFVDMEQCDEYLLGYFTKINQVFSNYEPVFTEAETLLEDLRNLNEFYHQFLTSYKELARENERRRQYQLRMKQMVEEMERKLWKMETEETAARTNFIQSHAPFLPATLCPSVQDLPDHHSIHRQERQGLNTEVEKEEA